MTQDDIASSIEEGRFRSFDGTEIFFQTWPVTNPKALILGVHGLGEYSGGYKYLAKALSDNQYQLIIFDHRGHGRSEGKRGVARIDELVLDYKIFVQKIRSRFSDLPYFYLGHSMGGLVLIKYLLRNGLGGACGAVLSSPFLGINVPIPAWKKKGAGILAKVLPSATLFNELNPSYFTHDGEVLREYERDHWRHDRISASLYISMLESLDFVFKNSDKMPEPVFFQLAGDDRVVSRPESEKFFKSLALQKKKIKIYEGYYHEIYNELGKSEPFSDLNAWLGDNLK